MAATRDLLFGLLALQNGMVTRDQLVAAFGNWTGDKSRSLADHLITMGHLGVAQRGVIEALADLHVEAHGGDAERSLAAIPAARSARCSLAGLDDHDLAASLAVLAPFAEGQTPAHSSDFLSGLSRITLADTEADDGVTLAQVTEQALDGAARRYEFMGEIARGGMGAVLKARDPGLGRELARP